MGYASLSYFRPIINTSGDELSQGEIGDVYLIGGGFDIVTPSSRAAHGLGINGGRAKSDLNVGSFTGGASVVAAVAAVKTITVTDNSLVASTDTLTVGTKTYTFVSGSPSGDQIQIGGSASATATNIATKITADIATIPCASAAAVGAVVTVTGVSGGADFALSASDFVKLQLQTSTVGVTAVSAATASVTINVGGRDLVGRTQSCFMFNNLELPADSGTVVRLEIVAETASGDTKQSLLTRMRNAILALAANRDFPEPTRMRFRCNDKAATRAQIATALQAVLGATPASTLVVTGTGNSALLTITAGGTGAGYNKIGISTKVENSLPLPLIDFTPEVAPNHPYAFHQGGTRDLVCNITTNAAEVPIDNSQLPLTRKLTGNTAQVTYTLVQNLNQDLIRGAASTASQASFGDYLDTVMIASKNTEVKWGLLYVSESSLQQGLYRGILLFKCISTGGVNLTRSRTAASDLPTQWTPQPVLNSPGCPYGYVFEYNTLAL